MKKIVALALVAILTLGSLAGCQSDGNAAAVKHQQDVGPNGG